MLNRVVQGKKTVLVADDDPSILDVIDIMLSEVGGYNVKTTADGSELLSLSAEEIPDLILLDIWMSGVDGGKICSQLKGNPATKDIPIIIFSANRDIMTIAEQSKADDYISKPFQMEEMLEKIASLIK